MQTYEALYIGSLPVRRAMGKCGWPHRGRGTAEDPLPWGWLTALCLRRAQAGAGADGDGVSCSPGMDVLNEAIEKLTRGPGRERWTPSLIRVSDTAMRVHPVQVGRGAGGSG